MKHLFTLLLFLGLPLGAQAQFKLGISSGLNYSYWKWHIKSLGVDIDYNPALDWRAAVLGEWQISPLLAARAEFGMQVRANKSGKLEFPDMVSTARAREHFQFVESSVLLQLSPVKKMRAVYLLAGVSGGYMNSAWRITSGTEAGKKFKSKYTIDINDGNWNRWAFAADFGLGGNIPLDTRSSLKIEGRFQYGLNNLSKNDNVESGVSNVLFNLGYLHRL